MGESFIPLKLTVEKCMEDARGTRSDFSLHCAGLPLHRASSVKQGPGSFDKEGEG